MKDHEIVELFFERSEQAIINLNIKYGAAIRCVTANILKDQQDIDECVNDTYLQVWNIIPPQRPKYLGAFSCSIARNISLNRYYFNSAHKRNGHFDSALDELEGIIPDSATVETEYDAKELAVHINSFLESISRDDRYLFMQRYWFGNTVAQIADFANLTAHTVSVRLFRIRKKLEHYLRKEGVIA